ncbi:MAG: nuclear transport factor 2 family protein [Thermoleophilaceae bacterium]
MTEPLHCPGCGATWYSAAAAALLRQGQRCLRCDTPLVGADDAEVRGESPRVRAVRAFYEAWLSRDLAFASELCHPQLDIHLKRDLEPEGHSSFHGFDGIQGLWRALPELGLGEFRIELCDVSERDELVASQADLRSDAEGEPGLSGRVTATWRFDGVKIRSLDIRLVCPEAVKAGNSGGG